MVQGLRQSESGAKAPHPWAKRFDFRRFRGDQSGASALEFALVATPLILLLLAVLQVGVVYFANFALEGATERAARLVRTGQAQSLNVSQFKSEVCKQLGAPLSCGELRIDIRKYSDFSSAASGLTQPLDSKGKLKTNFSYDPGARGDVMVVRAFYPLDIGSILPAEISLSNMAGNSRVLIATAAFRNEPF